MKILGISSNYHDASAALVVDGRVVCSSAEERFSYEKHDPSFPDHSIAFCLKQAGLTAQDLDLVVYHEDPMTKFTRSLASSMKKFPFSMTAFVKSARDMISAGFWVKYDISKALNISLSKIIFAPHHMSHAAHSFLTSPFDEAVIVTIDAVGEWCTSCIFKATKVDSTYKIIPLDLVPFPHSLGLVYSAFTGFLGFKVNDGECSTMALAAFGQPTYAEQIRKIISIKEDGTFSVDISYFDFSSDEKLPLTDKFIQIFGQPRSLNEKIEFSSLRKVNVESPEQNRYADIAASIQFVLEEVALSYMRRAKVLSECENLCYAGGVALNCVANSKIVDSKIFKNVYIPPDPGDGGGAMGAALYASMLYDKANTKPHQISPYLGREYPDTEKFVDLIKIIDSEKWHKNAIIKMRPVRKESLVIHRFSNRSDMLKFIAEKIYDHKIVGWMQGRFENGPRALGNRSILCRPDSISTAERLSDLIKVRSSFRPYACSITDVEANNLLEIDSDPQLSRWMQSSFRIKKQHWDVVRAASHIDCTTRAQVVIREENQLYYDLLEEYKKKSGYAVLLNTSFNLQGFPIVASPYDGLMMFSKTDLDIFVFNDVVLSKEKQ